jgi:hypothetical protein
VQSTRMITCAAILALVLLPWTGMATAQTNSPNYTFLLASGFLCDASDSASCPATVKATQGDSYEMSGAGTFDAQNKSIKAAGTFTHNSTNGNVLEAGVWTASELVSFVSYGSAPAALLHERNARLGPPQPGLKPLKMFSGPMPTGGLAVLRVLLLPMSGSPKTAILQVNCALGDVPRERSVEGIRLTFERNGGEFSEEVSGRVIFLSMQLKVSPPAKAAQQEAPPRLAEPPQN